MKPLSLFLPALFSYSNELGKFINKKEGGGWRDWQKTWQTNQTNKNENIFNIESSTIHHDVELFLRLLPEIPTSLRGQHNTLIHRGIPNIRIIVIL
jgi:hypothetical protein